VPPGQLEKTSRWLEPLLPVSLTTAMIRELLRGQHLAGKAECVVRAVEAQGRRPLIESSCGSLPVEAVVPLCPRPD